jgi:hypothetical protein
MYKILGWILAAYNSVKRNGISLSLKGVCVTRINFEVLSIETVLKFYLLAV